MRSGFLGLLCTGVLFFVSCTKMYDTQFDCPPGKGIPCTSVTQIESMVVETDRGADVVVGEEEGTWAYLIPKMPEDLPRKIWVPGRQKDCGCFVDSHYIYVPANGDPL